MSLIVFGVKLLKPSIWGREWRESSWWQDVNSSCCDEDGDWFEFGVQKSARVEMLLSFGMIFGLVLWLFLRSIIGCITFLG